MAKLLHVRHGRTDWNNEGRYTGQSDIPLNDEGRAAARVLADSLQSRNIVKAYSSDLVRAVETAEIIIGSRPIPLVLDRRLREINQGVWEGMLFDDIKAEYAREMETRKHDPLSVAPPEGEMLRSFQARVLEAVQDISKAHGENEEVLVTSHGLTIAVCRTHHQGIPIQQVYDYIPPNTEIVEIAV